MSWDLVKLFALLAAPAALGIIFVAACRLNAMPKETLFVVGVEYALWEAVGWAFLLAPFAGEWPGPVATCVAWALFVILLCSRRAWAGDVAPDVATDHAPLGEK